MLENPFLQFLQFSIITNSNLCDEVMEWDLFYDGFKDQNLNMKILWPNF
jgi:hypothetical protein